MYVEEQAGVLHKFAVKILIFFFLFYLPWGERSRCGERYRSECVCVCECECECVWLCVIVCVCVCVCVYVCVCEREIT